MIRTNINFVKIMWLSKIQLISSSFFSASGSNQGAIDNRIEQAMVSRNSNFFY